MHAWRYHRESNNEPYKHETPIKPLDDASSICETWYTWIRHEFLMNLLTDFCDGTTFHHLWNHKILSKRDDWILHVSKLVFGERGCRRTERDVVGGDTAPSVVGALSQHPQVQIEWVARRAIPRIISRRKNSPTTSMNILASIAWTISKWGCCEDTQNSIDASYQSNRTPGYLWRSL